MEYGRERGRKVEGVHGRNLGYDLGSVDPNSGELRLIEVKGLGGSGGSILLTPNERRAAKGCCDCYCLYVVTGCESEPVLQKPVKDPAGLDWHKVTKISHYWLRVDAVDEPMRVREDDVTY
ncbi:MAG: DUF3883 domain-containing protein [Candidatus Brocadiaceae bacterium]|jgi:hypothetical protein